LICISAHGEPKLTGRPDGESKFPMSPLSAKVRFTALVGLLAILLSVGHAGLHSHDHTAVDADGAVAAGEAVAELPCAGESHDRVHEAGIDFCCALNCPSGSALVSDASGAMPYRHGVVGQPVTVPLPDRHVAPQFRPPILP
jgi:hypothetical protein